MKVIPLVIPVVIPPQLSSLLQPVPACARRETASNCRKALRLRGEVGKTPRKEVVPRLGLEPRTN